MKTRNPAAVCGNCPYGVLSTLYENPHIECRRYGVMIDGFPLWYPETWCGEHPDFWTADEASDKPAMPEPDSRMSVSTPKGTFASDSKVTVNTLYGTRSFDWNFEGIIANLSELVALRHEMQELADLRERHERLRAHCDGLAEKVRELRPPMTMTVAYILGVPKCGYFAEEMVAAWEKCRADVLAILEDAS